MYHDSYWAKTNKIDINEYEKYYKYQEIDENFNTVCLYKSQKEIQNKFNLNSSSICTYIKNNKIFPNGNKIIKL